MAGIRVREYVQGPYPAFAGRRQAGESLAAFVAPSAPQADASTLVLALPRGGIPVAAPVAGSLGADLRPVLARKLPIPQSPQMGFGAVTIDGTVVLNEQVVALWRLDEDTIQTVTEEVRQEVERRSRVYPGGHPLPDMEEREVLLVDDGLATGYSMIAAASMVRTRGAARITVAVPVSPERSLRTLDPYADAVVCLIAQEGPGPFAVASFYMRFPDLGDEEVRELLG